MDTWLVWTVIWPHRVRHSCSSEGPLETALHCRSPHSVSLSKWLSFHSLIHSVNIEMGTLCASYCFWPHLCPGAPSALSKTVTISYWTHTVDDKCFANITWFHPCRTLWTRGYTLPMWKPRAEDKKLTKRKKEKKWRKKEGRVRRREGGRRK